MKYIHVTRRRTAGFSLVEMAMVLLIVGLLLAGLVPTISSQIEQRHRSETQKALDETKEALVGFAIASARLPCPASSTSNGQESFCTSATGACVATTTVQSHGKCSNYYNGFVPVASLGITPVDEQGYMRDSWNNRIRYAVASNTVNAIDNALTSANGIKNATMSEIADADLLYICASSVGINVSDCGTALKLSSKAPALAYSTGKNGATGGASGDELANPNPNSSNNDKVFVSHDQTSSFDDTVIWLSPNILFNRMVAAGKLP